MSIDSNHVPTMGPLVERYDISNDNVAVEIVQGSTVLATISPRAVFDGLSAPTSLKNSLLAGPFITIVVFDLPTSLPTSLPATTMVRAQIDGQLSAAAGELLSYGWDGFLPISTTWSGPIAGVVTRSFDDDFRTATESVNDAGTVSYQYDPDSLVELVDLAEPAAPDLDLIRDPGTGFGAGLLTGTVQGVVATAETPNAFGELESVVATANGGPLYALDVSHRDPLGRIETKIETVGAGPATPTVYTYDAAGRLDTVAVDGVLVADYAYDANGNRTHEREDLGGPPIAVYDNQDRLLSYAGTIYTYNAAGDLETTTDGSGTTTYGYDALGNLRSVVFPDGKKIEYVIDGQNRRVGKKVCPAPCTGGATPQLVQGFLYGDQLRIVAELDASNQVISRFVYASRPNVPDFMVKGGTTYRILSDQVGSVRLVVNATTGAIAQRIDYDAFGNPTYVTGAPDFQPSHQRQHQVRLRSLQLLRWLQSPAWLPRARHRQRQSARPLRPREDRRPLQRRA